MSIVQDVKRARAVGAPLVAIATADQQTAVQTIREGMNGGAPLLLWDAVRAYKPLNEKGEEVFGLLTRDRDPLAFANLPDALAVAEMTTPEKTMIVVMNAHRYLEDPQPIQSIMNLRDAFAANHRTLILLGPDFRFPAELSQDILTFDEALPTEDQIKAALVRLCSDQVAYDDAILERASDAVRGLATFPIEQTAALSVKQTDAGLALDIADMWERKRVTIRQTPGLSMERVGEGETFDDIGGVQRIKQYIKRRFAGKRPPRVVVLIEEIEKVMAGAAGDTSGTSQDQLGFLLDEMETRKYNGAIFVGVPGCTKSMMARAIAATFKIPLIKWDLGAAKDSLVGGSERRIRAGGKAIYSIAGLRGAFFIATSNGIANIKPELKRRFRAGVWYFDLPDADERVSIATIQGKANEVEGAAEFFRDKEGWSGANIRDACENAFELDCDLEEACTYIVSAGDTDPEGIQRLRQTASGRFLSASHPGKYKVAQASTAPVQIGRKLAIGGE